MPELTVLPDPSKDCTYPDVTGTIAYIAVFPPVGISRVGDSDTECFLSPEAPGHTSPPQCLLKGTEYVFRDAQQKLRRQAVRFRVYAYDASHNVLGELNTKNGYTLTWTVDVANKKAAGYIFQRTGRFGPHNTTLRNPDVQPETDLEKRTKLIVHAQGTIPATPSTDFVLLKGQFQGSKATPADVELAQLQLDEAGRLVFIPGKGDARSIANPSKPHPPVISEFDNVDWIDEVCDGSVTVEVKKNGTTVSTQVVGARVLSAPPKFAWGINHPTQLYDLMENIYLEAGNSRVPAPTKDNLDFWKHIWPVLQSASAMSWTNNTALQGHSPFSTGYFDVQALFNLFQGANPTPEKKEARKYFKTRIFEKLRKPLDDQNIDDAQADVRYMPLLSGDAGDMPDAGHFPGGLVPNAKRFASLTKLQYDRFRIWKDDDDFHLTGDNPPAPKTKLEDFPPADQPEQLTRAMLEPTTADPLFPGIEMYWVAKLKDTYNTTETRINPPFRINNTILSGYLTRGLSLPWQCDFDLCNTHWWPAIRPDDVVPKLNFQATVQNSKENQDFGTAITTRVKWTRGLRDTVFFSASQPDWPGSDDMISYWTQLGIVREVKGKLGGQVDYTAFLEDERGPL